MQKPISCIFFLLLLSFAMAQESSPPKKESQRIDLKGIRVFPKERKVAVEGVVNMRSGLVELLATAPHGKEHESVLVLYCNPALLQTSLLLLGLNPSTETLDPRGGNSIGGDRLFLYVQWQDKEIWQQKRAEELIWDKKQENVMPAISWAFTGSRFLTNQQGKKIFMANLQGVLVATYYDPDAIINNPLEERKDDTVYYANENVLPARGTPVTLIFTPVILETLWREHQE